MNTRTHVQMKRLTYAVALCALLGISACTTSPKHVDKQFGQSVRNMVQEQVYNPDTLKNPPLDVLTGMSSHKALNDIRKIYRASDINKQETKALKAPSID